MKTFVIIILILTQCCGMTEAALVTTASSCSSNTLTFKLELNGGETYQELYGGTDYTTCCASGTSSCAQLITGTGTNGDPYTLSVTLATATCGRTVDGGNSNRVTVHITALKTKNVLETEDKYITAVCDFSTGTDPAAVVTEAALTSQITTITATQVTDKPTLELRTEADAAVTSPITIGTNVKLKITIPASLYPFMDGVKTKVLKAISGDTTEISLTETTGCPSTNAILSAGFTGSGSSASNFVATTPAFKLFRFLDNNLLSFSVTFDLCVVGNIGLCATAHCSTGRKRRSVDAKNHTVTSPRYYITLSETEPKTTDRQPTLNPAEPTVTSQHPAMTPLVVSSMVWIAVVIILCTAVAFLAMTVVYLVRIRHIHTPNKEDHNETVYAYPYFGRQVSWPKTSP